MKNALRKENLMVLIEGREHSLRSFDAQPVLETGVWYLVSFCELTAANQPEFLHNHSYKKPLPVWLDLQRRVLIYRFGRSKPKVVVCSVEASGRVSLPHPRSGKMLTGTYQRDGGTFTFALRYLDAKENTVFFEFRKTADNPHADVHNPHDTNPSDK
jgi:hypothetical protein